MVVIIQDDMHAIQGIYWLEIKLIIIIIIVISILSTSETEINTRVTHEIFSQSTLHFDARQSKKMTKR